MALAIDPLIRLDGISKIFHTEEVETHALSRVSLDIRAGEFFTTKQLGPRAPRSAVGQLRDGRIVLVAVDGRLDQDDALDLQ